MHIPLHPLRKFLALWLLLAPCAAFASQPDPVTVGVAAVDSAGNPVENLPQSAFSVQVDGKPVTLSGFREINRATAPGFQQVIFAIDGINLDIHGMAEARLQLSQYLRANPKLPMFTSILMLGDEQERFLGEPTHDGVQLANQLDGSESVLRALTRSSGAEGAAERIGMSLQALGALDHALANQHGRKLVIWVSAGWAFFPLSMPTDKEENAEFASAVNLTNALLDEGITLDAVDPAGAGAALGFQATEYQEYLKGVKKAQNMQPGNLALEVLAVHSGGMFLTGSNDVAREFSEAVRGRSAYYVLQFPRAEASEKPELHTIAVHVATPNTTVHANTEYYAVP